MSPPPGGNDHAAAVSGSSGLDGQDDEPMDNVQYIVDSDDDERLQDAIDNHWQRSDTDCEMRSVGGSPIQTRNLDNDQVLSRDLEPQGGDSESDLDSESDSDPNVDEGMLRSLFIW